MATTQSTRLGEAEPLLCESTSAELRGRYETVVGSEAVGIHRSDALIPTFRSHHSNPTVDQNDGNDGETFDNVPKERRRLGLLSSTSLIFNFMIGTGIYATPSLILRSSGSVGIALVMWFIGALVAVVGSVVYIELGTGLPRSGGEKNYLEFIYRKPRYLMSCIFIVYTLATKTAVATSVVFGEYLMHALGITPSNVDARVLALCGLTFVTVLHGTKVQWGIRLQNVLGAFKFFVLCAISLAGFLSLAGLEAFRVKDEYEKPHNFEWDHFWEGSNADANSLVGGLYSVMWSFSGYSHINYALSEVKRPVRTVKYASALALSLAILLYFSVNIAYFAVVSKNDILNSQRVVVSLFFRNLFGPGMERLMSGIVASSVFGNMLSNTFAQGRVIQELGREGILPFSDVIASNKPFDAPFSAICVQYAISCSVLFITPSSDIYLFLINFGSYCLSLVNMLVALGVVILHMSKPDTWQWRPPFRAPNWVVWVYLLSNIFLIIFPFIPPKDGKNMYENLPYWSHSVTAFAVSVIGYAYWYWFVIWHPHANGYMLEREWVLQDDGVSRFAFRKVPIKQTEEQSC